MGISRDAICSDRIGMIADSGGMAEELTVFGTCYLEAGKIKYRVSNDRREIYRFLLEASEFNLYPMPVKSLAVRRMVPTGEEEQVLYEVKRSLAIQLSQQYPKAFFEDFRPLAECPASNEAWPLLEVLRDALEGRFEADGLQLYEMLIRDCLQKKLLGLSHKALAWEWLSKNRDQMTDDIVIKERNQRTFYGFLAVLAEGNVKSVYDLELERVMDKKIDFESKGILCGPILHKTFWYKDQRVLPSLRGQFDTWLQNLAGDVVKVLLPKLGQLPSVVGKLSIDDALPEESQDALCWYRSVWRAF